MLSFFNALGRARSVSSLDPLPVVLNRGDGTGTNASYTVDNSDAQPVQGAANAARVVSRNYYYNGTSWDRIRGDVAGAYSVQVGSSAAGAGLVPAVAMNASALLAKSTAGNLYSANLTAGATAGFLILYNSATIPSAGATLTASQVLACIPVLAGGTASIDADIPDRFGSGIVALFSTSATVYTVPANLAVHMRVKFA